MARGSTPLRLPAGSKLVREGINRLLGTACPPLRVGQAVWALSFALSQAGTDSSPCQAENAFSFDVRVGDSEFSLDLTPAAVLALFNSHNPAGLSGKLALALPSWMALSCLEAALGQAFETVERRTGAGVLLSLSHGSGIRTISDRDGTDGPRINLDITATRVDTGEAFLAYLRMDQRSLASLMRYWPQTAASLSNQNVVDALASTNVVCHLSLCRIRLQHRLFVRLVPGDTLALMVSVLEDGAVPVRGAVGGVLFLRGRVYPGKLVVDMVGQSNGGGSADDDISFDNDDLGSDWEEFEDEGSSDGDHLYTGTSPLHGGGHQAARVPDDGSGHRDRGPFSEGSGQAGQIGLISPRDSGPLGREGGPATAPNPGSDSLYHFRESEDAFDDIPLRVDLRVSRINVPFRNLKSFSPGMTIELEQGVPAVVDFVVDDRVIAQGELVDIEGTLGVTLTRIGKRKS